MAARPTEWAQDGRGYKACKEPLSSTNAPVDEMDPLLQAALKLQAAQSLSNDSQPRSQ